MKGIKISLITLMVLISFTIVLAQAHPSPGGGEFSSFVTDTNIGDGTQVTNGGSSFNGCCQETINGDFCVNAPEELCKPGKYNPLRCENLNLPQCQVGTCIDPVDGICTNSVSKLQCGNGEFYAGAKPNKCNFGGCILGGGCSYISKSECEIRSKKEGLRTVNFDAVATSSLECYQRHIASQELGCCVPPETSSASCSMTTKGKCGNGVFQRGDRCTDLVTKCPECQETQIGCSEFGDWVIETNSCDGTINQVKQCDLSQNLKCGKKSNGDYDCIDTSCNVGDTFIVEEYNIYEDELGYETFKVWGRSILGNEDIRDNGESWCVLTDRKNSYRPLETLDTKSYDLPSAGFRYSVYSCIDGKIEVNSCGVFRDTICMSDNLPFESAGCVSNQWRECMAIGNNEGDCKAIGKELGGMCHWDTEKRNECWPKYPPGYSDFYEATQASPNPWSCEPICGDGKLNKCDKNECSHLGDCLHDEGWKVWQGAALGAGLGAAGGYWYSTGFALPFAGGGGAAVPPAGGAPAVVPPPPVYLA